MFLIILSVFWLAAFLPHLPSVGAASSPHITMQLYNTIFGQDLALSVRGILQIDGCSGAKELVSVQDTGMHLSSLSVHNTSYLLVEVAVCGLEPRGI